MTRPNIVIVYTDDLGWGDLGCYGSPDVRTPHIDALAARGIRMTDWYSNSPVCSPSRASLLTGRHPAHAGVESILGAQRTTHGLPPQTTVASSLAAAGWKTAVFGKWHLGVEPGSAPLRHGFDHHFGFRAGCVDYYSHIMYWGVRYPIHDLWSDDTEIWQNGEYLTDLITDQAVEFIEGTAEPFLCYVSYNAPHYPMHAPADAMDKFAHLPWEQQVMAAMISRVDDGVGRIVEVLRRTGRLDDTIIFFSSDNGPSAEERNWLGGEEIAYAGGSTGGLRGHKGSVFEGGIRVPGIWSWPAALPAGVTCDVPAMMMDVTPTLLAAAGLEPDADLDGTDLRPVLSGADGDSGRVLTWGYEGQLAVRRGRWKLVVDPVERLGAHQQPGRFLFDLAEDRNETHDVAAHQHAVLAELDEHVTTWSETLERWRKPVTT
ncbi:arylsulfatase A-like enzyme [Kribbella sp. VKM Ac-2569]|uniref:sulfatase family protein n=1 Tax=Kribbella sp. VKM Ac-2569 TaxID=2512220 RepID=UPI00102C8B0F|nr:sulfatase-like hydrolase/transferase [Kribbella sp. VKM Ac-2569]RZT17032.1 arylsulfatase A-like enzyme [Kribbella sp. VKM Ac-2569]